MLKLTPQAHQIECWKQLDKFNGRAIIADEMGLGKTFESLGWVIQKNAYPCLIVTTASTLSVFEKELPKITKDGNIITIHNGKSCAIPKLEKSFILINYELLSKWEKELEKIGIISIIADEFHTANNPDTKKNRAFVRICNGVGKIILLSGTPFVNKEEEMFTMLNILLPYTWMRVEQITDAVSRGVFHSLLLQTCMIRREKRDVLPVGTETIRNIVKIPLTNQSEYELVEKNFVIWLKSQNIENSGSRIHAFAKLAKLRQLTGVGKIEGIRNWLCQREYQPGKTLAFFVHRKPINIINEFFDQKSVRLDGSVPKSKRGNIEIEFNQNDRIRYGLLNIRAGALGLTLNAATANIFAELPWTGTICDQCEGRNNRIGQSERYVNSFYAVAPGTIDERILKIIDRKRAKFNQSINGRMSEQNDVLYELLLDYRSNLWM